MSKFGKGALGYRNKNPGNIRIGEPWYGRADKQTDERFVQFKTHEWGISAMGVLLRVYQEKHGINTIRDIIARWAPNNENDTQAYIRRVVQMTGIMPDEAVNVEEYNDMFTIVKALITVELGKNPYSDEEINRGLAKIQGRGSQVGALFKMPNTIEVVRTEKQQQGRVMRGRFTTLGSGLGTAAAIAGYASDIKHSLIIFGLVGGLVILAGILIYTFWYDIKELKDGLIKRRGPV